MNFLPFFRRSPGLYFCLALAVFYILFLSLSLSLCPIRTSSEAREAHVAQVILRSGEWVLPTRNGIVPSKPPLYHWCAALVGKIMGRFDQGVARIPSTFFAGLLLFVTALRVMGIARAAGADRKAYSLGIGLLSVVVLSTTYGFLILSSDCQVDMTFSAMVGCAVSMVVCGIEKFVRDGQTLRQSLRTRDFVWLYFFAALATLAKGPLGVVLALTLAVSMCAVIEGMGPAIRLWIKPRLGWWVFLGIVLPWYVISIARNQEIFGRQIFFENIRRFMGGENVNSEAWWFYAPSFLRTTFPWGILAICFGLQGIVRLKGVGSNEYVPYKRYHLAKRACGVAVLVGVILFSLASGKRHSYLLPLFPLLSMYVTFALFDWFLGLSESRKGRVFRCIETLPVWLMGALGVVFFIFLLIHYAGIAPRFSGGISTVEEALRWTQGAAGYLSCVVAAGAGVVLILLKLPTSRLFRSALSVLVAILTIYSSIITIGVGTKSALKGFEKMAQEINSVLGAHGHVTLYKQRYDEIFDVILFYMNREVGVQDLESASSSCQSAESGIEGSSYVYFLGRTNQPWMAILRSFEELRRFRQPSDDIQNEAARDLSLGRCRA